MRPQDGVTDFAGVALPDAEDELTRRYARILMRWAPVGMRYYADWPVRTNTGHFFGGVLWYGQETSMAIVALALAASSPSFDPALAGSSRDELRETALKGLRYLCLTHDTGPADCVRPKESLGRTEPAGTKWGERGCGFFPESQCGRTIADLAVTAALLRDIVGPKEREMLAAIAADYLARFAAMEPRAGVYFDTQMEENGWTALGLVASAMLLSKHPSLDEWMERAKLWMFRAATMPRDAWDNSEFADKKTVAELCGRSFTMLPDGTVENHGFFHPSYLASGLTLSGDAANLLRLFGQALPPHLLWHRHDIYGVMKPLFDDTGAPHCVQGMDWPYFSYPALCLLHAHANVYLFDPDAALLERRALEVLERSSEAHGGRMVPEDTARLCHAHQDPALMWERMISQVGHAYLTHRLGGAGQAPSEAREFEARVAGTHVFPHAGALVHRHARGATSLAWRNRTMVLPATREGMRLIGPSNRSMLATVEIQGRAQNARPVALRIRESSDRVCVLLLEDLAEGSVRRQVFFASLPSGKCLVVERVVALKLVRVDRVEQGVLSVINDGYFGDRADLRGERRLFWPGGERTFVGYPLDSDRDDVVLELGRSGWVNVDGRWGVVFRGTGRALYHNRHFFKTWRAMEDELVLSRVEVPREFRPGQQVAGLVTLFCPEQTREETERQELAIRPAPPGVFCGEVDGFLCAANFNPESAVLPAAIEVASGRPYPLGWGATTTAREDVRLKLRLAGLEPVIIKVV